MILSEFVRLIDLSWREFVWYAFWIVLIFSTYTGIVYSTAWVLSRDRFIKYIMPNYYNGKLKIAKEEAKRLKEENIKLKIDNRDLKDRLAVIRRSI